MEKQKVIDPYSDRIPLEKCKKILNADGHNYNDEEVLLIRDFLYPLAQVDFDMNQKWFNEEQEKNNKMNDQREDTPKTKMTIIDGLCWKCNQPMKVAVTEGDGIMSNYCGPDEFTETELAFAKSKGVTIKLHDSKTADQRYLANTCTHCDTFVGGFYLFTQYIQPADMGEFKYLVYEI